MRSKKRKNKSGYAAPANDPADPPARGGNLSTVLHNTLHIIGVLYFILGTAYYIIKFIEMYIHKPLRSAARGLDMNGDFLFTNVPFIVITTLYIVVTIFLIRWVYKRIKVWRNAVYLNQVSQQK